MPGQATVTIKDKQWSVNVANTLAELTSGLSGVESMPIQTGMLFDLGYDSKSIQIDMSRMLFPLDIIFINSTQGVVGVSENIEPPLPLLFENVQLPGARFFLEVNAGEAEGIEIRDPVNIQGYSPPAALQIDFSSMMTFMIFFMMMTMMMRLVEGSLKLPWEKEQARLPPGYVPVRETRRAPAVAPPRPTEEEELQQKKLSLENQGREMARQAGVEFLRLDEGWQSRYWTPMYWFKDSKGNKIRARDLEELKGKLEVLK